MKVPDYVIITNKNHNDYGRKYRIEYVLTTHDPFYIFKFDTKEHKGVHGWCESNDCVEDWYIKQAIIIVSHKNNTPINPSNVVITEILASDLGKEILKKAIELKFNKKEKVMSKNKLKIDVSFEIDLGDDKSLDEHVKDHYCDSVDELRTIWKVDVRRDFYEFWNAWDSCSINTEIKNINIVKVKEEE